MIVRLQFTVLLVLLVAGCWRHPAPPRDEVMLRLFFQNRAAFEAVIKEVLRPDGAIKGKKKEIVTIYPGEDARLDVLMQDIGLNSITYYNTGSITLNYDAWGLLDYGWYKYYEWTPHRPPDHEISFDLDTLGRQAIRDNRDEEAYRPIEGNWYIGFMMFRD